jgi:acetolactate synthase-1/3 small subunit
VPLQSEGARPRPLRRPTRLAGTLALQNKVGTRGDKEGRHGSLTPAADSGSLHDLFMRHTLSVLVENRFGVLTRVAGMFSGRGFNIDTLNVAPTLDASMSRMTIVVRGDDKTLEQVVKQTEKLVDVIKVDDFRDDEFVDRELVLMRVNVTPKTRSEVLQICDVFRAKIVDVQLDKLVIEITGNEGKVSKFISLMDHFGIAEITRTGKVALSRTADHE